MTLPHRLTLAMATGLALVAIVWLAARPVVAVPPAKAGSSPTTALSQITRGDYLVRAGGCAGCHTARGGRPFAGGRGIVTPFGTVFSSNLTPDERTGLGRWSLGDFRRALHEGKSKDGRLLYPAFPYANYSGLAAADTEAMFAYLRSLRPVTNPNRPHTLRFPYDAQWSLAAWRARYFSPAPFVPDAARTETWNRGAYLVNVLGHCDACHGRRDMLGAIEPGSELAGGMIPAQQWYAPSLRDPAEGGMGDWAVADIVTYFKTGASSRGSAIGPMAAVVMRSTQFLTEEDLTAMAEYLKSLPVAEPTRAAGAPLPDGPALQAGKLSYEKFCADCHGRDGEGARGAYPALAGNRAVTMANATNPIRVVLVGAFAPATAGNPRPFGMPPFAHVLQDEQVASIVNYVRAAWGNRADPVTAHDVSKLRGSTAE